MDIQIRRLSSRPAKPAKPLRISPLTRKLGTKVMAVHLIVVIALRQDCGSEHGCEGHPSVLLRKSTAPNQLQ